MIKRCPITYDIIPNTKKYSKRGLKLLSPKLTFLQDLPFTVTELRQEALKHATKLSIQGVQQKLSVKFSLQAAGFAIVDRFGTYILKPQSLDYPQLPENEDLSMKLAASLGLETPVHGLIYGKDQQLTYFIKRFDRYGHHKKLAQEDFSQLSNLPRDKKYDSSMEQVIKVIVENTTFPLLEKKKLFLLTLFNYLIGNEDMHLKNFSLISRDNKIELSPAYDLLNTTIVLSTPNPEEFALPLQGKKRNLTYNTLIKYFAVERLGLNQAIIDQTLLKIAQAFPLWRELLNISFLSEEFKERYTNIIHARAKILNLPEF